MADRIRHGGREDIRAPFGRDFVNPYPQIPGTDARVMIELNNRRIPYSYRWFNDYNPYIKQLLPGWAPEFTLKDFKIVILVYGTFFGQIPGVLQQDVLATVILKQAGWRVLTWWEFDIVSRLDQLFGEVPELRNPPIHKGPYVSPHGIPDLMSSWRALRLRQKRYISANAIVTTRTRRSPRRTGGAFSTRRRVRNTRRESPRSRRTPRPRRTARR